MSFGYQVLGFGSGSAAAAPTENDNGIFAYGYDQLTMRNLVSSVGVVATDATGAGTGRYAGGACEYGTDKGIMWGGITPAAPGYQNMSNLVSNTGVVSSDVTGVGTARGHPGACEYGGDKGIIAYGNA